MMASTANPKRRESVEGPEHRVVGNVLCTPSTNHGDMEEIRTAPQSEQTQQQPRNNQRRGRRNQAVLIPASEFLTFARYEPQQRHPVELQRQKPNNLDLDNYFLLGNFRVFVSPKRRQEQLEHPLLQLQWRGENLHIIPRAHFDWEEVCGAVRLRALEEELLCPICLEEAAGVPALLAGRCGHPICAPCACRLFAFHIEVPCPLCHSEVLTSQLRPIELHQFIPIAEGGTASFCLLMRQPGSSCVTLGDALLTAAEAVASKAYVSQSVATEWQHMLEIPKNIMKEHEVPENSFHSIFNCSVLVDDPRHLWRKHISALEKNLRSSLDSDTPDAGTALTDIEVLKFVQSLAMNGSCACESTGSANTGETNPAETQRGSEGDRPFPLTPLRPLHERMQAFSDLLHLLHEEYIDKKKAATNQTEDPRENNQRPGSAKSPVITEALYFYQATDGQPIFLEPFCFQMLWFEAGGDPARLPPVLKNIQVLQLQEHRVYLEKRPQYHGYHRGLPFLQHLPMNSTAQLADVDLGGWLAAETMAHFEEDLKRRTSNRKLRQWRRQQSESAAAARASAKIGQPKISPFSDSDLGVEYLGLPDLMDFPSLGCGRSSEKSFYQPGETPPVSTPSLDFKKAISQERNMTQYPTLAAAAVAGFRNTPMVNPISCSSRTGAGAARRIPPTSAMGNSLTAGRPAVSREIKSERLANSNPSSQEKNRKGPTAHCLLADFLKDLSPRGRPRHAKR